MDLATPHQVTGCGKLETFDMVMLRRVWLFVVIVSVIAGCVKEKREKILGFRCDGSDTIYNVELYILLE